MGGGGGFGFETVRAEGVDVGGFCGLLRGCYKYTQPYFRHTLKPQALESIASKGSVDRGATTQPGFEESGYMILWGLGLHYNLLWVWGPYTTPKP